MKFLLFLFCLNVIILAQKSFEDFKKQNQENFQKYKEKYDNFQDYMSKDSDEFKKLVKEVAHIWGDSTVSSNFQWVYYNQKKNARVNMDFDKNEIKIEITEVKNKEEIKEQIKGILETIETQKQNVGGKTSNLSIVEENIGYKLSEKINETNIVVEDKRVNNETKKVFQLVVPFKEKALDERAQNVLPLVNKYAKIYQVDPAQIMAQIHTESAFNPRAHSFADAYGLMQLVPKAGGGEAYKKLTGKTSKPTAEFLFDAENNIQLGCLYVKILNDNYFSKVSNLSSRQYLIICAYNTGAGNVAKTFTGNFKIKEAITLINELSSDQIYKKLIDNLPYIETRKYIKKINERMTHYRKSLVN